MTKTVILFFLICVSLICCKCINNSGFSDFKVYLWITLDILRSILLWIYLNFGDYYELGEFISWIVWVLLKNVILQHCGADVNLISFKWTGFDNYFLWVEATTSTMYERNSVSFVIFSRLSVGFLNEKLHCLHRLFEDIFHFFIIFIA